MTEKGFIPLTSELGLPGTLYRLQLGIFSGKWAARLLKGRDVVDSYVYEDIVGVEDIESDFPIQHVIIGWVLRTLAKSKINPHQVMKTTQALVKQASQKKEQRKVVAPISGTKDFEPLSTPYIFNPPSPPGDLGIQGEAQVKVLPSKKSDTDKCCKHCGAGLPLGQSICPVCKKKVI